MTNYNERLDEITDQLYQRGYQSGLERTGLTLEQRVAEAKQALTSLIKELVAGAKPEHQFILTVVDKVRNNTIDEFEQNLLKALEEV